MWLQVQYLEICMFWKTVKSTVTRVGNFAVFWPNRSFLAKKWANEWFNKKNERFTYSLIFGEQPERLAHIVHFWWATWAIRSHCSLKNREWVNHSFFKKLTVHKIIQKAYQKYNFNQFFEWINRFLWGKEEWAIRSFIYHEQPEQIAHSRSFFMSDLSDWLTVAHLSWAIWANRP